MQERIRDPYPVTYPESQLSFDPPSSSLKQQREFNRAKLQSFCSVNVARTIDSEAQY